MTVDWQSFTPWSSLAGGLLIGASAAAFVWLYGHIAGISGALGGLLKPAPSAWAWRLTLLVGMLSALWLFRLVATLPDSGMSPGLRTVLLAGLPVGYRTCLESGRASGHCVCGLCRSSPRSLLATACRMGAGFATVYVVRHLLSG